MQRTYNYIEKTKDYDVGFIGMTSLIVGVFIGNVWLILSMLVFLLFYCYFLRLTRDKQALICLEGYYFMDTNENIKVDNDCEQVINTACSIDEVSLGNEIIDRLDKLEEEKIHKKKKRKKIVILAISLLVIIGVVCSIFFGIIKPNENSANYYYTKDFTSLNSKEQVLCILRREGEPNLNDDASSYGLEKKFEDDGYQITIGIGYYAPEDELSFQYNALRGDKELVVQIFLAYGKPMHGVWSTFFNGSQLVAIGHANIYAPTFYNNVLLSFDEYGGDSSTKSTFAKLVSQRGHELLKEVNTMLQEYNFSIEEFGFERYVI